MPVSLTAGLSSAALPAATPTSIAGSGLNKVISAIPIRINVILRTKVARREMGVIATNVTHRKFGFI
jgi:hypothetical protein